ncbi:MAG: rRNA maturation RNase YbeY [Spirochaetota bacterium]|nr:MAG: rRNA maturation RNase YbeY [Spirochaetota bacterium]
MSFKVFVREEQRKLPVSQKTLKKIAQFTFHITGIEEGDISLVVCDDKLITKLNESYMKRSGPTDVLAFSMLEGKSLTAPGKMLGDIVISADTAAKQAGDFGETLEQEFLILFIHGLLHLLGFDHKNIREKEVMQDYTDKILMGMEQTV